MGIAFMRVAPDDGCAQPARAGRRGQSHASLAPRPRFRDTGAMSLVTVAYPQFESHVALIVSALDAAGIPHHVQGAGLGSLLPGLQIASYNQRKVLVPETCAEDAVAVIAELGLDAPPPDAEAVPRARDKWRNVLEFLLLGWIVPGVRRRRPRVHEGTDDE
jgi:hypothetical protein